MFAAILDPDDDLLFGVSFASDLATGETITGAAWTGPAAVTITNESITNSATVAQAKFTLSGVNWYEDVKCVATTSDGETYTRRIRLFQENQ